MGSQSKCFWNVKAPWLRNYLYDADQGVSIGGCLLNGRIFETTPNIQQAERVPCFLGHVEGVYVFSRRCRQGIVGPPHSSRGTGKGDSFAWIGKYDVRGVNPPIFSTHVISPFEAQSNLVMPKDG